MKTGEAGVQEKRPQPSGKQSSLPESGHHPLSAGLSRWGDRKNPGGRSGQKNGDQRVAAKVSDADRGRRRSVRCADCSATWENTTFGEGGAGRTSIRNHPARDQKLHTMPLETTPPWASSRRPGPSVRPGAGAREEALIPVVTGARHPSRPSCCGWRLRDGSGGVFPVSGCHRVFRFEGRSGGFGIWPLTAFRNRGTGNQEHEPGAKEPGGKGTSIHDNLQSSHLRRKSPAAMRMTELYGFCGATFRCLLA